MDRGVTIELLNHASIILRHGAISLLCDPWFDGTCFRGGWGLRYINPTALEKTSDCTHLWISHFHNDHLHMPTLQQVAQRVSQIHALANVSVNSDMRGPLQRAGFTTLHPLYERYPVSLSDGCEVTRYPTTGIDNMLVVRIGGLTILNLNDCNLPARALRHLIRKIGHIDILLANYNHAGKLIEYPSHEQIKETFKTHFQVVVAAVNPTWVIPFASLHYYRSHASAHQNGSFLRAEELTGVSSNLIALAPGDRAIFEPGREPVIERLTPAIRCTVPERKRHEQSIPWQQLVVAAEAYRTRLRHAFLGLVHWISPLAIRVKDLERVLVVDVAKGISEQVAGNGSIHIEAHSEALFDWLGKPFGADAFWVGADFGILARDTTPVHRMMLAGLLLENRLALKDLIRMLVMPRGWSFLLHRREEILAILLGRRFGAGDSRRRL
jgi:L-ascorbate metabolism protein UlaG (beta-lactamase superfamily)